MAAPGAKAGMQIQIFLGDGMRANHNFYPVALLQVIDEGLDIWARWIANQHPGSQVDDLGTIPDHFFAGVFDIAAWATIAGRVAHQLNLGIAILGKGAFLFLHRPKAFPAGTVAVAVANYDSDLYRVAHLSLLGKLYIISHH